MIKQIHLNQCDSTQDVLKEQLSEDTSFDVIIVSCDHQISGRGRGENIWVNTPGTICFSMNLKPHPVLSFTAIEISVIISDFFAERGKILNLKWPNDLWDSRSKKCGGILIQMMHEKLITGIGLNLFSYDNKFGSIFESEKKIDRKLWSRLIGEYILKNRISDTHSLKEKWLRRCIHLNREVTIRDGENSIQGLFCGIGEFGEALISNNEGITKIYNGSLIFN